MSLSPSRIFRLESVIKHGMLAKLTNSGTLVVNGVLVVSSYADDEVQSFVPDHVLQNLKKMLGGDQGIHRLIHKLVAPYALGAHLLAEVARSGTILVSKPFQ